MRKKSATSLQDAHLVSKVVGPLPLLNGFLDRLQIEALFARFVPSTDRRLKLAPAVGLGVLLRNILLAREPLYGLTDWTQRFDEALLGLPTDAASLFNDDRVGRCLDALFLADRAALMTAIVVGAVRTFKLDLNEMHNDSTSISFSGEYAAADGTPLKGRATHRITHGHSKDYRPDLKQLLFVLTTTADGGVPIWSHVDHGNTSDDGTHIATWDTLRQLTGTTDFLYVADCKLCSQQNLGHIAREGGRFVTVLPATWGEQAAFYEWILTHEAPWIELLSRPNPRRQASDTKDIYRGYEWPMRTAQGFRVLWIWSSQKEALDRATRERRIDLAVEKLQALQARIGQPRSRLMNLKQIKEAVDKVLHETRTERWIITEIHTSTENRFAQATRGRPGPQTAYVRHEQVRFTLQWRSDAQALLHEARTDGLFPLITNDESLSIKQALVAYKHQPALEKRFEQCKSVLEVRPMLLKSHTRIEAFLFLYFVALLTEALIEREIRGRMKSLGIAKLPIYPEGRLCAAPTTDRLFYLFQDLRRHRLVNADGHVHQRFYDALSEPQKTVLRVLGLSEARYLTAAEEFTPQPKPGLGKKLSPV
ncbi:MAG: IS1634 family transposase [Steroidobacteraceae bacterium]